MLKIAICDDDILFCSLLEKILLDIRKKVGIELETEVFYSCESLINALIEGEYVFDLIFLDIEFRMLNGVQLGQKIREELHNETVQIIYVSGNDSYAMSLFDVRPLNFLIKPVQADKVEALVKKVYEFVTKGNDFFEFKYGHVQRRILLKDILYFESSGKKVRLILGSETAEFYGKLNEIEKQISSSDFIPIHKSYLINYCHVVEYQYEKVKLVNDVYLPISQAYRKPVRDRLLQRRKEERQCT